VGFQPGHKKHGGRTKGTLNKYSIDIRAAVAEKKIDLVDLAMDLYHNIESPPEVKFKVIQLLFDFSAFKPKNPLDLPGAVIQLPLTVESRLSTYDLERAIDDGEVEED